jgi:protease I
MKKVLLFVDDIYEDMELWYPKFRMEEAGYKPVVAGPEGGRTFVGKHGYPCKAEISYDQVESYQYAALIIPGGFAPDKMRRYAKVLEIVREMDAAKKPIAFICHAGWVPISAKILKGKKVTGFVAIKDDLENAGAHFSDKAVVIDGHLISSRTPADLPVFCQAILETLK